MIKADIKNGMIVQTANGNQYIVWNNTLVREHGYIEFNHREDFTCPGYPDYDIIAIFEGCFQPRELKQLTENKGKLLWKRKNIKKIRYTTFELEQMLHIPFGVLEVIEYNPVF